MSSSRKSKVVALSIGQTMAKLIGIVVTMVMARLLIKEDLAAYRQTLLAYATVAPLLTLGVGQGMFYFLPAENDRVRGRVMDGLMVAGFMGLLFALFLALGGNQLLADRFSNPKIANMLLWMIPYAIITTPSVLTRNVLVACDQVSTAAIFGVVKQLLIGVATVIPLILWQTAEAPLIGNVTASILMAIASFGVMLRLTPNDSATPSIKGTQELVSFSFPLALAGMIGTISLQLDKIIVSVMCSPEEFAIYALGAMEIPLIGIVTGSLTAVTITEMRKSVADGKADDAVKLFRNVALKSSYVILPAMVFLFLTADTLIVYLYSDAYSASAIPFRFYLLLLPIRTVVFGSLIMALGMSRFILFRSAIGLILNGTLSVVLVWLFGPWGAVVATILTIYCWTVPSNLFVITQKLNKSWKEILPISEMMRVIGMLIPVVLLSILSMVLLTNVDLSFLCVTVIFALFLAFYWNNRIYSFENLKAKMIR